MANLVIFKSNQTPQYLESVNTPEYEGDPDVIINPDITAVRSVPLKHWKRNGNAIVEMSASEKIALEQTELQARKAVADNYGLDLKTTLTALIKVINLRLPAGQKITRQEMIDALKGEIN